ncbi:MAG: anion transporter, partial [Cyclobacteriaceae bacterium]
MNSIINKRLIRLFFIILGPLTCFLINTIDYELISPEADRVLSVAAWMVIWWISEPVSISVTALLPIVA